MLTQERLKEVLRYENGEFIWIKNTSRVPAGTIAGAPHSKGYVIIGVDGKKYYRSNLVWLYFHGSFPKDQIDHINGIKNDDHIENLREATSAENMQNWRRACRNSKSGILGVSPNGAGWMAQIRVNGKTIHLGTFPTKEEAGEVYLAAKRKYHKFCTI